MERYQFTSNAVGNFWSTLIVKFFIFLFYFYEKLTIEFSLYIYIYIFVKGLWIGCYCYMKFFNYRVNSVVSNIRYVYNTVNVCKTIIQNHSRNVCFKQISWKQLKQRKNITCIIHVQYVHFIYIYIINK